MFINELKKISTPDTYGFTENGAVGHLTTKNSLLDFNFKISSYRNLSEEEIFDDFLLAYIEDRVLAFKFLFYARDVRGGLGERRLFRAILKRLVTFDMNGVEKLLPLIPEFGRWDDLFILLDTPLYHSVIDLIKKQLIEDLNVLNTRSKSPNSISLLGKWLYSENASSAETKRKAKQIRMSLCLSPRDYRKILSKLRKHLEIVEQKMSTNDWEDIDYEKVPSKANLVYNKAFFKHDGERRESFLEKVNKGEAKINSGVNFPHDIVHKYTASYHTDNALEALWKALPKSENLENTLVVADGSGSMLSKIGKTSVSALTVAQSLAIYFAEKCAGQFKNHYITFSETPKLVNLGSGTLRSKIDISKKHCEVANTNIAAVFSLILKTAIYCNMNQSDLPKTVLIISDMEFDEAVSSWDRMAETLFDHIKKEYQKFGFELPRLVFWNVMSRSGVIPVTENENGVILVSGFSPNAIKMVLSGHLDPYDALVEVLSAKRYDIVEETLNS